MTKYKIKNLIISSPISTIGVADDTPKISYVLQKFDTPQNILLQAVLTSNTFNRQVDSFWKVELTIDSWEAVENGVKVQHTVPEFSIWNPMEIANCNWVKVRLTAQNGAGSGIVNIYTNL